MNENNTFLYPTLNAPALNYMQLVKPYMEGCNKRIACEPFPEQAIVKDVKSAFAVAKQKTQLTGLKVVYGNATFPAGVTVYLKGDQYIMHWAKEVFELPTGAKTKNEAGEEVEELVRFIMVPEECIMLVRNYTPDWNLTYTFTNPVLPNLYNGGFNPSGK